MKGGGGERKGREGKGRVEEVHMHACMCVICALPDPSMRAKWCF